MNLADVQVWDSSHSGNAYVPEDWGADLQINEFVFLFSVILRLATARMTQLSLELIL